jgi:2-methylisocitrate lyase-like PEP mutase family enzyme
MSTAAKAEVFRKMNTEGNLLLPNAWDAASARVFEEAGFAAIGTTSAGIAYGRGLCDGERIGREAMMGEIAVITASVDVPAAADIEAGYGTEPRDIAETIRQVIQAGAVGVNLEDNAHGRGSSYSLTASCSESGSERRGLRPSGRVLR